MVPLLNKETRGVGRKVRKQVRKWKRLLYLNPTSRIVRNRSLLALLNLVFAIVEWLYGDWNNSWALKADCLHGLYDCSTLLVDVGVIGMRSWRINKSYSYGYARAEVLACFGIGLTQVYLGLMEILLPAIPRLMYPGEVGPERMILISVVGLFLNLLNNYVQHFQDRHLENNEHGDSKALHKDDTRVIGGINKTLLFSILVDILGSVALVISAIQTQILRSMTADTICSMVIALCMIFSVLPMMRDTGEILIQRQPVELDNVLSLCYKNVYELSGVNKILDAHFWTLNSYGFFVGTLILEVVNTVDPNQVVQQVKIIFNQVDVKHLTVELNYVSAS